MASRTSAGKQQSPPQDRIQSPDKKGQEQGQLHVLENCLGGRTQAWWEGGIEAQGAKTFSHQNLESRCGLSFRNKDKLGLNQVQEQRCGFLKTKSC